jgi:hypothetical protein
MWSVDAARLMNKFSCRAPVWCRCGSLAERTGLDPSLGPGSVPGVEGPVGRGEVDSLGNRFDADGQRAVKTELRTLLS